ncbi:MAG: 2-dehydropantoate 2-reductase [Puniceicoccaceae bacterium]
MEKSNVAIIGAGALGSYFGIRLAHAGNSVSFLLRSDYDAVRESGMKLILSDGTAIRLENPGVHHSVREMGPADCVIIGLKTTRNYLFPELLPAVVGPETVLVTIQNGLGNVEALEELFPGNPVIGALCQIGVNREAPGRIRSFVPKDGFVLLGKSAQASESDLETIQKLLSGAGINTRTTPSLGEALWRKLMWNVPFNGLTVAIGGKPTDAVCGDPALRSVARGLMEEIRQAGNTLGYAIEPEYTDKLLGFTDKLGPYMASSVHDWLAGRQLEVKAIFRKPLEAGTGRGVKMPYLESLTAILAGLGSRRG